MTTALSGVWANGYSAQDLWPHLQFLIIFSVLMVIGGWFSYRQMLERERRL